MYEFHGSQSGTGIRPGDTINLDFSVHADAARARRDSSASRPRRLRCAADVGQDGPDSDGGRGRREISRQRARCGSIVALPERSVTLGFKYFDEFSNESTFEGYSLQISVAIELD